MRHVLSMLLGISLFWSVASSAAAQGSEPVRLRSPDLYETLRERVWEVDDRLRVRTLIEATGGLFTGVVIFSRSDPYFVVGPAIGVRGAFSGISYREITRARARLKAMREYHFPTLRDEIEHELETLKSAYASFTQLRAGLCKGATTEKECQPRACSEAAQALGLCSGAVPVSAASNDDDDDDDDTQDKAPNAEELERMKTCATQLGWELTVDGKFKNAPVQSSPSTPPSTGAAASDDGAAPPAPPAPSPDVLTYVKGVSSQLDRTERLIDLALRTRTNALLLCSTVRALNVDARDTIFHLEGTLAYTFQVGFTGRRLGLGTTAGGVALGVGGGAHFGPVGVTLGPFIAEQGGGLHLALSIDL